MATQKFNDQVPDYVAGQLSPDERLAFEKALEGSTELKEAVAIWGELDEVLAPAPEDQLLENIIRLRSKPPKAVKTGFWSWKLGIPLLFLAAALSWFFWPYGKEDVLEPVQMNETNISAEENGSAIPSDTLQPASEDSTPTDLVRPTEVPVTPTRRPPSPQPEEEVEPPPMIFAANYDPNPLIESEMKDQLRGGEVSLKLVAPTPDASIRRINEAITLSFNGQLSTELAQEELTIRLLLLSNRPEDYLQSNYLIALPAVLTPATNGFTLTIEGSVKAEPGLYYYVLEWEEEETYLKIGRLRVE